MMADVKGIVIPFKHVSPGLLAAVNSFTQGNDALTDVAQIPVDPELVHHREATPQMMSGQTALASDSAVGISEEVLDEAWRRLLSRYPDAKFVSLDVSAGGVLVDEHSSFAKAATLHFDIPDYDSRFDPGVRAIGILCRVLGSKDQNGHLLARRVELPPISLDPGKQWAKAQL